MVKRSNQTDTITSKWMEVTSRLSSLVLDWQILESTHVLLVTMLERPHALLNSVLNVSTCTPVSWRIQNEVL